MNIQYTIDLGIIGEVECDVEYTLGIGTINVTRVEANGSDITSLASSFFDNDEEFYLAANERDDGVDFAIKESKELRIAA